MKRNAKTASTPRQWILKLISRVPMVRAAVRNSSLIELDDVAQETARRHVGRTSLQPGFDHAHLRRTARNIAIDHFRRQRARGGGNVVPIEDAYDAPAVAYPADQESALLLKQVILGLPPLYRDVFILNRFLGLTYAEIAQKYGLSVKAVEYRMSRALALCEEALRD